ncbi:MAG TPA: polysaccharide biosynthesis tyrosine autokinase [Ktedonobacteraceae bacterium]
MGNFFRYYTLLTRRWMWLFVVCALVCSGATYLISSFLRPVYQASAYLIINVGVSAHPSISDSLQAVPTFAQLVTIPTVLDPVVAQHPGLNSQDLLAMLSVKPQTNTQIIELDIQAPDPRFAASLANQVSQSFAHYANASAQGTVQIIPASMPAFPVQPRPLQSAGIGALVGLVLAILLSMFFEWIGNRPTSVEQVQKLLDAEILALLPRFSRKNQRKALENYRMLCAGLDVAQAGHPFKLIMVTSALAGEGKTTIAGNIAIHLAQAGKQVLLVDLNIHHPTLAREFHLSERAGLTNVLARGGNPLLIERYAQATAVPGLSVLLTGTQEMSSAEFLRALTTTQLLSQLKQASFDYVLFDAPSLLAVAEAQVLASSVEALVLVVDSSRTPCKALVRLRQLLWRMQTTRVLGVVLNQSSWHDYADTHSYVLPQQPSASSQGRCSIEEVTVELPTISMKLIPAPLPVSEGGESHLPDTGESERISPTFSERVIRPGLSLSGLAVSGNGLIRRTFRGDTVPSTPEPLLKK